MVFHWDYLNAIGMGQTLLFWINIQQKVMMLGRGLCKARRHSTEINGQINIEAPQGLCSSVLAYRHCLGSHNCPCPPTSAHLTRHSERGLLLNVLVTQEWTDQLEMPPLPWAAIVASQCHQHSPGQRGLGPPRMEPPHLWGPVSGKEYFLMPNLNLTLLSKYLLGATSKFGFLS